MNYRHLIVFGYLLIIIFFTGCIQQPSSNTTINPMYVQPSPSSTALSQVALPLNYDMDPQSTTAYFLYNTNRSYEISIGNITVVKNMTPGSIPSDIIMINITAKNLGKQPIELGLDEPALRGLNCMDAHLSPSVYGGSGFEGLNPGESMTQASNCTIFNPDDQTGGENLLKILYIPEGGTIEFGGSMLSYTKIPDYEYSVTPDRMRLKRGVVSWIINLKDNHAMVASISSDSMNTCTNQSTNQTYQMWCLDS